MSLLTARNTVLGINYSNNMPREQLDDSTMGNLLEQFEIPRNQRSSSPHFFIGLLCTLGVRVRPSYDYLNFLLISTGSSGSFQWFRCCFERTFKVFFPKLSDDKTRFGQNLTKLDQSFKIGTDGVLNILAGGKVVISNSAVSEVTFGFLLVILFIYQGAHLKVLPEGSSRQQQNVDDNLPNGTCFGNGANWNRLPLHNVLATIASGRTAVLQKANMTPTALLRETSGTTRGYDGFLVQYYESVLADPLTGSMSSFSEEELDRPPSAQRDNSLDESPELSDEEEFKERLKRIEKAHKKKLIKREEATRGL
ncbi:hypothetical protein CAEBREN_11460 [Caenorhabditis brenneri]|uniref:Uncharacterized protein n=1 Tax=Caenorhabditis brenneri TaxID=135651 RepID=G0N7G4_CAEBE|nr:hypothetical protein CAEBREN_11460 [Caenorhabditis brenneri]